MLGTTTSTATDTRLACATVLPEGLPDGRGINIAHECVDRHARLTPDAVALRFRHGPGRVPDVVTYAALRETTARFAAVLADLGVRRGEVVALLLGRTPDLHTALLGTLKHGAVACPLYPGFGPEPVRQRLAIAHARVLVTTSARYLRKLAPLRSQLPELQHVLVVGPDAAPPGTVALAPLLAAASPGYEIGPTAPDDPALVHFTSGTTGPPKAAVHVHGAVVAHLATAAYALDLRPGDVFWCTADPGWVTGTSYGILAPLGLGVTNVVDDGAFDAERWYALLTEERVSVWYTTPTALRLLRRAGTGMAREYRRPALRLVASVGEPLDPATLRWGIEAFGRPVHDTWWQTETGSIMIADPVDAEVRPGSMGVALPGVTAAVVRCDDDGRPVLVGGTVAPVDGPDDVGLLVVRREWPSMFRGYLDDPGRYERCFVDGWYLTGDLVRRDAQGWYRFVGRADDMIKTAGHLVGPFEVEQVLLEHPAVAAAAVVGAPDPVLGQAVTAYVVLRRGHGRSDALVAEVLAVARRRLGPVLAPRTVTVVDQLPETLTGKIARRLLRAGPVAAPAPGVLHGAP